MFRLFRILGDPSPIPMTNTLDFPTQDEVELAKTAARRLASSLRARADGTVTISTNVDGEASVVLPRRAAQMLVDLLAQIANGNAVTLLPVHAHVTTQQAADILNVSRPFLVKLIEAGEIPYQMVGTHRRLRAEDVFAYRRAQEQRSRRAISELSQLDQELGFALRPTPLSRAPVAPHTTPPDPAARS
jgi:excisionase family DNA binding protein